MKHIVLILLTCMVSMSFGQEDKEQQLALKKANGYVYEGNSLINEDDFVSGEMAYRQAISKQPNTVAGIYNLGNAYYKKGNYEEALYRHEQAAKATTSKSEKHKAYHNIGNILMQNKKCKEAVEAFKNALRNDPTDDETRYNLGLAKICAEEQKDQQDENKDDQNKDENKEDQDKKDNEDKKDKENKEGDDKEDKKDKGDEDKKEGEDEKDDEGKPKDEKKDKGKGDDDKKKEQQKPKPQPGQMSPQQIKNLLEAMNNQEQKVQEKMNAVKEKGVKIKTEKDW